MRHPAGGNARRCLLADIRRTFIEKSVERIFSRELLESLTAIEDAPWSEMPGGGKPLRAHRLGFLLKPYGIRSKTLRIGDRNGKGFSVEDFEDPFKRYLPAETDDPNGDTVTMPEGPGFEGVGIGNTASPCDRSNGNRDSECDRPQSPESHADADLSPCDRLDRPDAGVAPAQDPNRFAGMHWREQQAARLREIRERRDSKVDDDWAGDV